MDNMKSDIIETIEGIFENILSYPEELSIDVMVLDRLTVVSIKSVEEDVGIVIGRKGQNVNAIKTILDSYSIAKGSKTKYHVEVSAKD